MWLALIHPLSIFAHTLLTCPLLQEYKVWTGNHHIYLYVASPIPQAFPSRPFPMVSLPHFSLTGAYARAMFKLAQHAVR